MITEAIILAGGFGTRLKHVLGNIPKPMAPVDGRPFLAYLFERLRGVGINHVILSTGYMHEKVQEYFGDSYRGINISYAQETTPLFTGGAIALASTYAKSNDILVLNGDTLFDIDFAVFQKFHFEKGNNITIALRKVENVERYGAVKVDADGNLLDFVEKGKMSGEGFINGGIYIVKKDWLLKQGMPSKFSFEKEILEMPSFRKNIVAYPFGGYFIDIGVPEDYYKAQREFGGLFPKAKYLFLDRDGTINKRVVGGYVTKPEEFVFLDGVKDAMAIFAKKFDRIFIVTNQRGIGKKLFTEQQLEEVHSSMMKEIVDAGGRIDRIYHCVDLTCEETGRRKPEIGMAKEAKRDFPELDFAESTMVGDSISDLQFGYKAGMQTVYLLTDGDAPEETKDYTDKFYKDLKTFAETL